MASHKTLKSVVRGLAESFTSLMNYWGDDYAMGHVVYAAWVTGGTILRVDLVTGRIDASPLLVPEVRNSLTRLLERFPDMVCRSYSDLAFVSQAELIVTVDPRTRRPHAGSEFYESPFTCTARIVDDRGKVYEYRIADWWYPEKPLPAEVRCGGSASDGVA